MRERKRKRTKTLLWPSGVSNCLYSRGGPQAQESHHSSFANVTERLNGLNLFPTARACVPPLPRSKNELVRMHFILYHTFIIRPTVNLGFKKKQEKTHHSYRRYRRSTRIRSPLCKPKTYSGMSLEEPKFSVRSPYQT